MIEIACVVVFLSLFEAYCDRTPHGYSVGVRFRWYRLLGEQLKKLTQQPAAELARRNGERLVPKEQEVPF